jgi:hypothetical protein
MQSPLNVRHFHHETKYTKSQREVEINKGRAGKEGCHAERNKKKQWKKLKRTRWRSTGKTEVSGAGFVAKWHT